MGGSDTDIGPDKLRTTPDPNGTGVIVHATTIVLGARGVMIFGPSGSGKSTLAAALIARSARLIADDRTKITVRNRALIATAPAAIAGQLELRGIGIVGVPHQLDCKIALAVNLGAVETARLPKPVFLELLGCRVPLLKKVESAHFPEALALYLDAQEGTDD